MTNHQGEANMANVNEVRLMGNLGVDPDVKRVGEKQSLKVALSVASERFRKDRDSGETEKTTTWNRVILWGQSAEYASKHLHKGDLVYVEGYLETRKWTDPIDGDRYMTEVIGERVQGVNLRKRQSADER
jgi:single-strand DNA-binding protein